jgi:WD40 repeat protein
VAYSPDGSRLASAAGLVVSIWNVVSGANLLTLRGHREFVHSVAFHPDRQRVVSASLDETVKIWDAVMGSEILTLRTGRGPVGRLAFNVQGTLLAVVTENGVVEIWDGRSPGESPDQSTFV